MIKQTAGREHKLLRTVLAAFISAYPLLSSRPPGGVEESSALQRASASPPPIYDGFNSDHPRLALGVLVTQTLFLPVLFRDYSPPYTGLFEIEPNNVYTEATGPLMAGRAYAGYPDDLKDYFSVYAPLGGPITVTVENKTGTGTQLHLYYGPPVAGQYVGYAGAPPFTINCATSCSNIGWYYIYIYTASNFNATTAYTLTATYP